MTGWKVPTGRQDWRSVTLMVFLGGLAMVLMPERRGVAQESRSNVSGPFEYDAKDRRDPFKPLIQDGHLVPGMGIGRDVEGDQPVLYGILWDPAGTSLALMNDGEYKVGDVVNGYQVVEIRRDAVVITSGGERTVLQITFDAPSSPSAKHHNGR